MKSSKLQITHNKRSSFFGAWSMKLGACKKGFTLIELLIVMGVLAVLFTALLTAINPIDQFKKARDATRKTALAQIQRGLEAYFQDHGKYPDSSADYRIISVVNGASSTLSWGAVWNPYMSALPKDPKYPAMSYAYYSPVSDNGQTYYLYASLERGKSDPNVCNSGAVCTSLPVGGVSPCGGICNFGISSPNTKP